VVCSGGIDTVFISDHFPKFGTNLVTALTSLQMANFSHFKLIDLA
jgi:hypothetical protein